MPSWNDGPSKKAITALVRSVTDQSNPAYVTPAERIAVFDNDGTLWPEQPPYFQFYFAMDRVRIMADEYPKWKLQKSVQETCINKGYDENTSLKGMLRYSITQS